MVATEALAAVGLAPATLDVTLPTMTPALLDAAGVAPALAGRLARALDRKDAAAVDALSAEAGPACAAALPALLRSAGPADGALRGAGGGRPAARRARHRRQRRRRGRRRPRPRAVAAGHARPGGVPRLPLPCRRRLHPLRAGRHRRAGARRPLPVARRRAGDRHDALPGRGAARRAAAAAAAARVPAARRPDAAARGAARRGLRHRAGALAPPTRRSGSAARTSCATAAPCRCPSEEQEKVPAHGQRRRHRRPVGRRGQGQGGGLARQPRRHRGALPGRPQRRPHAGGRQPDLQAARCCPRAWCAASSASSATAWCSTRRRCWTRSTASPRRA